MTTVTLAPTTKKVAVKPTARIEVLDVLRGFALFGIILVHSSQLFPKSIPLTSTDNFIKSLLGNMLDGRAASIFCFLFGLSFAIQIQSAHAKNKPFFQKFLWRTTILFFIGYCHSLIYSQDILQDYAVFALLLIVCARIKDAGLLTIASLLLLTGIVSRFYIEEITDWLQITTINDLIQSGRFFMIPMLFIIGYYAGRNRVFDNKKLINQSCVWSIIAVLALLAAHVFVSKSGLDSNDWFKHVAFFFKRISQSVLYVSAIAIFFRYGIGRKLLHVLSPIGKMGLSIYVLQSIILVSFYKSGIDFASMGLSNALTVTLFFFLMQIVFAKYWLTYFKYGPLEWLWRSATELKLQPIRKAAN